jgi:hypothetical protein
MTAPVPKCVRVSIEQTYGDDPGVTNVFHVASVDAGPYDSGILSQIAEKVFTAFTTNFRVVQGSALSYTHAIAKDLSVDAGAEGVFVPSSPVVGAVSSAPLPANCALVVSWKESGSYRGGHPRTYLTAIPAADVLDPQHVASAYATAVQTAAETFRTDVTAGTEITGFTAMELVVVHFLRHLVTLAPPEVQPLLAALVNVRLDSQRRRLKR